MNKGEVITFDVASALSLGARSRQEDALAVAFPERAQEGFAILSDGMGGHACGDLASRTIVAEMFRGLTLGDLSRTADLPALLKKAMTAANESLSDRVRAQPVRKGMGGTVVAVVANDAGLHWISVGDSVLYLFRAGSLSRLNENHSMAPQIDLMVAQGVLSKEKAADHPQRNCLTAALMGHSVAAVDCPDKPLALRSGDILILASDGLQFLPDSIIQALLLRARRDNSRDIARNLMDALATMNDPEQDNTSIVVIRAEAADLRLRESRVRAASMVILKAIRRALAPPAQISARR